MDSQASVFWQERFIQTRGFSKMEDVSFANIASWGWFYFLI